MKAIDFLIRVTQDLKLAENSWVESIWSERELRMFESNAIRKKGCVKVNNDYFCSYLSISDLQADAIYFVPEFKINVYCYKIYGNQNHEAHASA